MITLAMLSCLALMRASAMFMAWVIAWGFGCAVFEKFRLAPRRRLSVGVPVFFSGIVPAAIAFVAAAVSFLEGTPQARSVALTGLGIAFVLFLVSSFPAGIVFRLSRILLRTRFDHELDTKHNAAS